MPEFILDYGDSDAARIFATLDEFTQGYVTAAFWTETGTGDDNELEHATFAELAPEALASMVADCADFQAGLPKDHHERTALDLAYDYSTIAYDAERAGVDFWLTRNGHGAGYQDRGLGPVGDELRKHAKAYGNVDLYRGDDGLIYTQ